jgi:MinD superfamily P-loop ATPase containing an inserted ferredoxin domain
MKVLYFTGTGNSLSVAKRFDAELLSIPKMKHQERYEFSDDAIGFIFPCFMYDVPPLVKEFLKKAELDCEYTFAIFTCGEKLMAAPHRMKKFLAGIGKEFDYINGIVMTDNYIPMFEQSEQVEKLEGKDVNGQIVKVIEDIENRVRYVPDVRFTDRILVTMMQPFRSVILGNKFSRRFLTDDQCNKCGTCVKVCPSGNISVDDTVHFHDRCETCLACIHLCPRNAIHLKKEKSSVRFRNPDVTVNEIISSNDQSE